METKERDHRLVRIPQEAKLKLLEMAEKEQRQPVYQLQQIVEKAYEEWKEHQDGRPDNRS